MSKEEKVIKVEVTGLKDLIEAVVELKEEVKSLRSVLDLQLESLNATIRWK